MIKRKQFYVLDDAMWHQVFATRFQVGDKGELIFQDVESVSVFTIPAVYDVKVFAPGVWRQVELREKTA